tara:strand:- start:306 stop:767 length:462 start_codon:yes stop_codon:yes gene_type:complete
MNKKTKYNLSLGKKLTIPSNPEEAVLEKIKNLHKDTLYVTRFSIPEFTSICPVTKQPDFGHLLIDYVPSNWLIESKSMKYYINSFRNYGIFHEDITIKIGKKILSSVKPKWLRIGGYFYPRGGIPIDVFWQSCSPPKGLWVPKAGIKTYKGRA